MLFYYPNAVLSIIDEEKRRHSFYKSRGLCKVLRSAEDESNTPQLLSVYDDPEGHYYKHDDQICICLDSDWYV